MKLHECCCVPACTVNHDVHVLVAARSKALVCGRSLAGIAGSNSAVGMDIYLFRGLCVVR